MATFEGEFQSWAVKLLRLSGNECLAGYRGKICLPTPDYGPVPLDVSDHLRWSTAIYGVDREGKVHENSRSLFGKADRA